MSVFLKRIELENTPLFKKTGFDIEPGLSVIYGLNKTNARHSGNGNGAGKSAFFSQLGEILYENPIVGERQDALKEGRRVLKLDLGGKAHEIVRTGSKLEVLVDGKSKFRTKPMAKEWLTTKFPISESEFNTYVHIDARIPHPLVMGSSTERKRFFTSFFGLDKLDLEKRLFMAELSKLGKVRAAYDELRKEYSSAKNKLLGAKERTKVEQQVKEIGSELEDLNTKNTRLQNIAQLLAFEASAGPQLKFLDSKIENVTAKNFETLYKDIESNLKQDLRDVADAKEWLQYRRDNKRYHAILGSLSKQATEFLARHGLEKALAICKAKDLEYAEAYTELKGLKDLEIGQRPEKVDCPELDKKKIRADLDAVSHRLEHARKFKSGTCETCGQDVKTVDPEALKARLGHLRKLENQWAEYEQYVEDLAAYKELRVEAKKTAAIRLLLEPRVKKLKSYRNIGQELRSLPDEPTPFKGRRLEVDVKQQMVDEDREQLQIMRFLQPNLLTVLALKELTMKQRNAGSLSDKLRHRINTLQEQQSKLKASLSVDDLVMSDLKRQKRRLSSLKTQLEDEDALKLLVEGYSDKAIKKMAVQAISSRLMTEVNKYARFVFTEDYVFDFVWASQLQLLVHRKYGAKTVLSDVRKLSGAESKLFAIVLVLALLTFVPQRKRCNVLILDEPTANFSPETTERFKALIPILLKVIPTIIIITPRTEDRYEGATEWTVIKESGSSKIAKGHPTTLRSKK